MVQRKGAADDEPSHERAQMLRPEVHVLDRSALVPDRNLVRPAPTHFTHELAVDTPFHLDRSPGHGEPDGVLPAGTAVVVAATHGDRCRVVDGRGLAVEVPQGSVRELGDAIGSAKTQPPTSQ